MNFLRYWARYVCKEEVKGGGIRLGLFVRQKLLISPLIV